MKDKDIPREIPIDNPTDLMCQYQKLLGFYKTRQNNVIREWLCLLSTLTTNLYIQSVPKFLSYPYSLTKREEPDFKVALSSGEVILVEITRATTMKNEALKHQLSKADDDVEMAEVSNDMFTLEKPNKGEMRKNLVVKGEGLQGTGMIGWYAENQWVSIILSAIESKRSKVYSESVDLLLIDDRSLPTYGRKAVIKRFELLKSAIESDPKTLGIIAFPNIITDTSGALGIIRQDNQWLVNPLFLPDGWMAD